MANKIGIILTTYLRNELAFRIIQSIQPFLSENTILLIGDQNKLTEKLNLNPNWHYTFYYTLPEDCGLSYGRNYLVQKANELGCNYIFLTADSYEFNKKYNLESIIEFLELDDKNGLVGFIEDNKPDPKWCWDIEFILNQCFLLKRPKRPIIEFKGLKFQPCDITQNFYLAKTKMLLDVPHDNELKLCEHEDIMYRFKQVGWKIFFNDSIHCKYNNEKPIEYNEKRRRIYTEYKQKLLKKYGLKSWIRIDRS